jgi:predicted O-linked N-acetylglucosamine transferase (SPINDLY family)
MPQLSTPPSARKTGLPPPLPAGLDFGLAASAPAAAATPSTAQRHWQSGRALAQAGDWPAAARAFGRATRAAPADALYWLNLAHAQRHLGRLTRAVAAARRCLQHEPGQVLALRLLGECLMLQHRYAQAREVFTALESAGALEPESMVQHAAVLMAMLRFDEAAALLLRALSIKPEYARAHAMLASALRDQGLKREAVECLRTAITLDPSDLESRVLLSFEKRHVCDWSDYDIDVACMSELLAEAPRDLARMAAVFVTLSLPVAPELQLKAARGEALMRGQGALPLPPVQPASRANAAHRVRVGFLSYDFREHPVSQLIVELLEGLDRSRFEVLLYSTGPDDHSAMRHRVVAAADRFVDIASMGEEQGAQRIRADGVDVLVDLMGHTRGNRMSILARRPAPLQVAYLGYPGSTGCALHRLPDRRRPGHTAATGTAVQREAGADAADLPAQRPLAAAAAADEPQRRPGLPEGAFVMCAFNHTYKIGPEAFDAWCAVMRDVPHAVLWLKETNGQLHDNVRREAAGARRGPAAHRVRAHGGLRRSLLAPGAGRRLCRHLALQRPHHGGRCPVGRRARGHADPEQLSPRAWRPVCSMPPDWPSWPSRPYPTTAAPSPHWRLDPALLAGYRQHLHKPAALPLFDGQRYTREFETLLQRMWARWRAGLSADHLPAQTAPLSLDTPLTPLP